MYKTYLKDHEAPEDIEYYMCGPGPMSNAVNNMLYNLESNHRRYITTTSEDNLPKGGVSDKMGKLKSIFCINN